MAWGIRIQRAIAISKPITQTSVFPKQLFDTYLVGQQATYPEDEEENVTDSASAATAMVAGVKTHNNAIALDNDKSKTETVLERAKKSGEINGACSNI